MPLIKKETIKKIINNTNNSFSLVETLYQKILKVMEEL